MTINDQIRDENLQYDINGEAVKISALSSSTILEYEDHGQKQIKAIQDQGQLKTIKKYAYDTEIPH